MGQLPHVHSGRIRTQCSSGSAVRLYSTPLIFLILISRANIDSELILAWSLALCTAHFTTLQCWEGKEMVLVLVLDNVL